MALCSGPFKCVACAAFLICVAHGARDTESASAFASFESEVKDLDKASADAVVNVGANGSLIALHMLERASATPERTQIEAIQPALVGEPGELLQQGARERGGEDDEDDGMHNPSAGGHHHKGNHHKGHHHTGNDSVETLSEPPPEPEVSVQELLEGTPGECANAKVKKRDSLMTSLGIGKTDYQMQLNDLSKTCNNVASQQKDAKKTMDQIAEQAEKLKIAEVEYEEILIRLDEEEKDIKAKGELIGKMDAAVKKAQ